MTQKKDVKTVEALQFDSEKPTDVSFADLYTWVIWQFPRKQTSGLYGAVHPPIAEHGWLPAVIYPKKQQISIHAYLKETFSTPEEAASYLQRANKE